MLYAFDNCELPINIIYECFDDVLPKEPAYRDFALEIFKGVCARRDEIDAMIAEYAQNWELDRMAVVDRNIIRLAAFEIIAMPKTPINVIIDEAVEISKRFSTADSGKFVNGILDKLKAARQK
jgi:N utilization substance protein B